MESARNVLVCAVAKVSHYHRQGNGLINIVETIQTIFWDECPVVERVEAIDMLWCGHWL